MKYILMIFAIPFVIPYYVVSSLIIGGIKTADKISDFFYWPDDDKSEEDSSHSGPEI